MPVQDSERLETLLEQAEALEEKGDRYIDGEKAKRFYERACQCYQQMNDIHSGIPEILFHW